MEYRAAASWPANGESKPQPRAQGRVQSSGSSSGSIGGEVLWLPSLGEWGTAATGALGAGLTTVTAPALVLGRTWGVLGGGWNI